VSVYQYEPCERNEDIRILLCHYIVPTGIMSSIVIVTELLCTFPVTHTDDLLANHIKHKVEKYEKEC